MVQDSLFVTAQLYPDQPNSLEVFVLLLFLTRALLLQSWVQDRSPEALSPTPARPGQCRLEGHTDGNALLLF